MPVGHQQIPQQLIAIAQCESGLQQYYDNGTLVTNPESGAMGVFQTLPFHQKLATKMGLDLTDTVGNMEYGIWLYNRFGSAPWLASKDCWSKKEVAINAP
jgi:hypothetical protein